MIIPFEYIFLVSLPVLIDFPLCCIGTEQENTLGCPPKWVKTLLEKGSDGPEEVPSNEEELLSRLMLCWKQATMKNRIMSP